MRVIILAAGKGTRMKIDIPKVLVPLAGKTLIEHALNSVYRAGIEKPPLVVVGHQAGRVKKHLSGYDVDFVVQKKQLGTAHAVMAGQDQIDENEDVMVLYGDHPLIDPQTLRNLQELFYSDNECTIAMVTFTVPDFDVWNGQFKNFGRIIRNEAGDVVAIRESRDASAEELLVREINPAYYLFRGEWLWNNLKDVGDENSQKEYYLTDLIEMAIKQNKKVRTVQGKDLKEAIGVNTEEQLLHAFNLIKSHN